MRLISGPNGQTGGYSLRLRRPSWAFGMNAICRCLLSAGNLHRDRGSLSGSIHPSTDRRLQTPFFPWISISRYTAWGKLSLHKPWPPARRREYQMMRPSVHKFPGIYFLVARLIAHKFSAVCIYFSSLAPSRRCADYLSLVTHVRFRGRGCVPPGGAGPAHAEMSHADKKVRQSRKCHAYIDTVVRVVLGHWLICEGSERYAVVHSLLSSKYTYTVSR